MYYNPAWKKGVFYDFILFTVQQKLLHVSSFLQIQFLTCI